MTVFAPLVALGTNARSSGSAPTNVARAPRASSRRPSNSRARNCTGCRSIRARSSACASSTGRGHAPKEPWLRKSIPGSSVQWRARSSATRRLRRELVDEEHVGEAEAHEQRAQRLPRRLARPVLKTLVRAGLRLECIAGPLEELRRLLGVEVRADDLGLRRLQLHLRLHAGEHHLHAAPAHPQRALVELAQIQPEV